MVHCSKENRLKISQISKLAKNTPKNDKRTKQTRIPSFWGDVGVKKWSLFSDLAAQSPIFWALENKHLFKKCSILGTKNGSMGARIQKRRPLFSCQYPPKSMERTFVLCVYHFCVNFKPILKFCSFWTVFGPFYLEQQTKIKSVHLPRKVASNKITPSETDVAA